MAGRIVIIGAGIAGLGSALGLARQGWSVTVVERDRPPTVDDGDDAFTNWDRRMVAQFRQPHGFSSRSRNLLNEHAPDVLQLLRDDGIEEFNAIEMARGPDDVQPDDHLFTGVLSRRPAFELALRRAVEAESGIDIICPARATGLVLDRSTGPVRVTGIRMEDGSELSGDLVLDCGGRRSPVTKWLADAGIDLPAETEPTELVYFSRYYRREPTFNLFLPLLLAVRGELDYAAFAAFPGDHQTYGLLLAAPPWDDDLRILRHNWAWEAAARAMEGMGQWIDPIQASPVADVQVMHDQLNIRRRFVVDGDPLVAGLLPVGDSLCATNPFYGWGASLALTYAFAAADAVAAHPGDLRATALAYDAAVAREVDACYAESAAMDRMRVYRWRGEDVPPEEREVAEQQELVRLGVMAGMGKDPVLLRAFLRRQNLVEPPDAVFDDPDVMARARAVRDRIRSRPPRRFGPTRDELLTILDAARPVAARA